MAEQVTAPVAAPAAFQDDAARVPTRPGQRGARPRTRVLSHHARIAGSDAHWLAAGTRGEPVVLVHGLGNSSLVWRRVIAGLARDHRVVAPDLPGFGHSSPVPDADLLDAYVRFVAELIEHNGGVPAAVVGNSVGGAVALRLALIRPELVSRLVLVDPAGVGQGVPSWWRLVRFEPLVRVVSAVPLTVTPKPVIEWVIGEAYRRMAFADPGNVSDRSVRLFAERLNSRERIHRFLRSAHRIVDAFDRDVESIERPLPVPVLAVWGREDRLVPLHDALALLDRIGGLEVRVIEGTGHSPQLERPQAFLDAVSRFLSRR